MISLKLDKKLDSSEGEFLLSIDIEIPKYSFTILCGDSGAGKTSILRMLSGLMTPDTGRITYDDTVWYDSRQKINLSPKDRGLGFVFQEQALFPNMTVRQNLAYALAKGQHSKEIDLLITEFQLDGLQDRKPATLSGGQKQKVSLARSIINRPKLLLLDEPLSALDQKRRMRLQDFILKAHRDYDLTTIMVSHDAAEINKMAQAVLSLENGKVSRITRPGEMKKVSEMTSGTITKIDESAEELILKISLKKKSGNAFQEEYATGEMIWVSKKM
ncbi:MAG: ATP-binding cassette domain-containing protein [Saprospiraceae bacterium]|nr:ATP-binding cassette domain-containing protein [Saprospiraceae bacterium]